MKYNALMYYGQKYFGFEELEMPACGENDMIVKNLTASICGSDTDTWLNGGELHYLPPRVEFGHEVVCEVVETGKNVTGVKPGDRIAPYPLKATPNPRKAGYLGGFSEYLYITNAKEDENFWILDERMSNKEAALIEPLSVSIHVADRANVTEKTIAVILGAGIIGAGVKEAMRYGVARAKFCKVLIAFCVSMISIERDPITLNVAIIRIKASIRNVIHFSICIILKEVSCCIMRSLTR